MGRKWTPEQKKAASERAKAAIENMKDAPEAKSNLEMEDLKKQVEELKSHLETLTKATPPPQQAQSPQVTSRGIIGIQEKFVMDPAYYPDPTERLAKETKLAPFAFNENFEVTFECAPMRPYERKDGIMMTEPQFTLRLIRKVRDEDTNELTNQRYVIRKGIFFEDPQTALVIAQDNGIDFQNVDERLFLDEMRYLRFKDWLFEGFFPPKSDQKVLNKHDVVIGNKLVEVYELNSEAPEDMKSKLGQELI